MTNIKEILKETNLFNLNESSFFDIHSDVVLTKQYIEKVIDSLEYRYDGLEDEDTIERAKEEIIEEIEENFYNAEHKIYQLIKDHKIEIYRAIVVDSNWEKHLLTQGKHLGIYWAWDIKCADAHWGYDSSKRTAILTAIIDERLVDWKTTMEQNSHLDYFGEREIRLVKNTPIKLKSITIDDTEIDLIAYKDKKFFA